MKRLVLVIILMFIASLAQSQEYPFRVGVKLGIPEALALSLEGVTPSFDNRLGVAVDGSFFSPGDGLKYSYFTLGANYYFSKPGSGFYGHLGYGNIHFQFNWWQAEEGSFWELFSSQDLEVTEHRANLKLGFKSDTRLFFRGELGYGVMIYEKLGETTTNSEGIGGLLLNIGFGYAF